MSLNDDGIMIVVMASYRLEHVEIRFIYTPIGWRPDLMIDHVTSEVTRAPSCFKPTDAVIEELNAALVVQTSELPPVGVYEPELN